MSNQYKDLNEFLAKHNAKALEKTDGKTINKYVFPPPVEGHFYGDCILVNVVDDHLEELSISDWTSYHEECFSVSEEVHEEKIAEDNELEEEPYDYPIKLTVK